MLTKKQKELFDFISARTEDTGVCPSFDEMRAAIGQRSKSGVHRLILSLEERGFIRRLPNRARAIEIVKRHGVADTAEVSALKRRISKLEADNSSLLATVVKSQVGGRAA